MLNRRAFLQRFGIGLSAALTLASLPASAVEHLTQTEAGKLIAREFLRKRYTDYMRGRKMADAPWALDVPQGLYDAYDGELIAHERFIDGASFAEVDPRPHLAFKAARLQVDPSLGPEWDVRFLPIGVVRFQPSRVKLVRTMHPAHRRYFSFAGFLLERTDTAVVTQVYGSYSGPQPMTAVLLRRRA